MHIQRTFARTVSSMEKVRPEVERLAWATLLPSVHGCIYRVSWKTFSEYASAQYNATCIKPGPPFWRCSASIQAGMASLTT